MDTTLVGKTWDSMHGEHLAFVQEFYQRFFQRFPRYNRFFPHNMDSQMKKMVRSLSMAARMVEDDSVVGPHIEMVGEHHRKYGLQEEDLDRFKEVFIEVLAERCADGWTSDCAQAWEHAFEVLIIPMMMRGLGATHAGPAHA